MTFKFIKLSSRNPSIVIVKGEIVEFHESTDIRGAIVKRMYVSWTYFNDLYTELFIVRITPLVETDLFSLLPIYAALL